MFRWLFKKTKNENPNDLDREAFREAISIDTSGHEFKDLYPTEDEFKQAIVATELIKSGEVDWIAKAISNKIRSAHSYRSALQAVTREGDLLTPKQLKSLGANPRRKVGSCFIESLVEKEISKAYSGLENVIIVLTSNANKLHNLRRMRNSGITHCKFLSAKDERCTDLDKELEGKRFLIEEAIEIVENRGSEITRSVFTGEVKF